ncbi:MAG: transposase [Chloroflexales bacterium]|nr:transposase [Chloroflexales bacterium]
MLRPLVIARIERVLEEDMMGKSTYTETANAPQPPKRYASDCTNAEWAILEPFTRKPVGLAGRKRNVTMREIVNALFYRTKTDCQWRMFPKEFPV